MSGSCRRTNGSRSPTYKTYRNGQVTGFVPALERLAVRISATLPRRHGVSIQASPTILRLGAKRMTRRYRRLTPRPQGPQLPVGVRDRRLPPRANRGSGCRHRNRSGVGDHQPTQLPEVVGWSPLHLPGAGNWIPWVGPQLGVGEARSRRASRHPPDHLDGLVALGHS